MPGIPSSRFPPPIRRLLDAAFANRDASDMLTLGVDHQFGGTFDFLREGISELKQDHGLSTLALERPLFFNLFLDAYADGTLIRLLGSQAAARGYLTAVFRRASHADFAQAGEEEAALAIAAMDAGVRVVAYDGRDTLAQEKKSFSRAVRRAEPVGLGQEPLSGTPETDYGWVLAQAQKLADACPDRTKRLAALEALVVLGETKGLEEDAQHALVIHSLSLGNTLVMAGIAHLDGQGDRRDRVQGTLPEHLAALSAEGKPAPKVTVAMIVTTSVEAVMEGHESWLATACRVDPQHGVVSGQPVIAHPFPENPLQRADVKQAAAGLNTPTHCR